MKSDYRTPKWVEIFEGLQKDIRSGAYPRGVALPSEGALMRKHKVSRITAVRVMDELRKRGLVWRKRGSGTFATDVAWRESGRLGFIFPSLSFGEIFPAICQALTRFAQKDGYSVVLGDISSPSPSRRAHEACEVARMFVGQKVAGVVFQPLAFLKTPERVSRQILAMLGEAGIPVVLVDRDVSAPDAPHDFVGIDNLSAGRTIGAHLVSRGARRISFLMRPKCASVIRDRVDGVMSVAAEAGRAAGTIVAEPSDAKTLAPIFSSKRTRPDAVVCESDYVAAQLRNTLAAFGLAVPGDVRLAGFDDVRCAISATPPLTTVRQPCEDLALVAYQTLRERMRNPEIPARRILLPATLVAREST